MTGAEILLRFIPGPLINLWRLINQRPRPDIRIVEIKEQGGASGKVDFAAFVANYGTQQARVEFKAHVGSHDAECVPRTHDLIPEALPERVTIIVRRPEVGDLVPAFANETTLYGERLELEAIVNGRSKSAFWDEKRYEAETNAERYRIQQDVWRQRKVPPIA